MYKKIAWRESTCTRKKDEGRATCTRKKRKAYEADKQKEKAKKQEGNGLETRLPLMKISRASEEATMWFAIQ